MTRVATRLRVSGGELKKRCAAHHAARPAPASTALGFVEVTAPPVRPHPPTGMEIELHRPDGTRLRIRSHEPQPPWWPWCGPSWRRPDAPAHPAKPHLCWPRSPSISAKASMGWRPSAAACSARIRSVARSIVFRNRAGTALKILCYDGQGYWLCTKRLSQGRFTWWPTARTPAPACPRASWRSCSGMAIPSRPGWRTIGKSWR